MDTLTIFNIYCFSMATTVTQMSLSVTLYVICMSCLYVDFFFVTVHRRDGCDT